MTLLFNLKASRLRSLYHLAILTSTPCNPTKPCISFLQMPAHQSFAQAEQVSTACDWDLRRCSAILASVCVWPHGIWFRLGDAPIQNVLSWYRFWYHNSGFLPTLSRRSHTNLKSHFKVYTPPCVENCVGKQSIFVITLTKKLYLEWNIPITDQYQSSVFLLLLHLCFRCSCSPQDDLQRPRWSPDFCSSGIIRSKFESVQYFGLWPSIATC